MPHEVSANQVLANEALAPLPEVALSEPDYRAFCAALEASARGRAFLAEYARRNRHADTATVLAALDRLETLVRSQSAGSDADRIKQELHALLAAMRGAQPIIEASAAAIKAAKLAGLIGFVRHRIESIVAPMAEQSPLPPEVAALVLMDEVAVEAARSHLAVVPRAEEPELPIPAPAAGPPPAIALVQATPEAPPPAPEMIQPAPALETIQPAPEVIPSTQEVAPPAPKIVQTEPEIAPPTQAITPPAPDIIQRSAAIIPEINLFDGAPIKPAVVEPAVSEPAVVATVLAKTVVAEMIVTEQAVVETRVTEIAATPPPPVFELTLPPPAVKPRVSLPVDPLAHIMALSDEERIALFS